MTVRGDPLETQEHQRPAVVEQLELLPQRLHTNPVELRDIPPGELVDRRPEVAGIWGQIQ